MKSFTNPVLAALDKKFWSVFCALCMALFLCSCTAAMREYYSHEDNFVSATGVVIHMVQSEEYHAIYFGFSDLSPKFDDVNFKIVGDNVQIVLENGISEKIKLGDTVEFVTAPRYFGDGYVMPIVAISVDGEQLLDYEEGYANFMEWLEKEN